MITLTDVLAMSSGELIETLWNVNVTISFLNLAKCPN